ncbi:MAG: carbon storage regulator [Clostridia bacterium]|nr:carbon storage regulator [Clostridia bacterium]MBQ3076353.1 carbon storage regulator [Clostridia bacterium]
MLILQRKSGESLLIGEDISVTIVSVEGNRVRLAISAPGDVPILRSELVTATAANRDSAVEEAAPADLLGLLGGVLERTPASPLESGAVTRIAPSEEGAQQKGKEDD